MANMIYGSICLSDVPKELFKKVTVKSGEEKIFLNIKIVPRKAVGKYGHTHFVSCEPRKEERVEGKNYIIGDMKEFEPQPSKISSEQVEAAPSVNINDLPF
jgi:hypothetical protein